MELITPILLVISTILFAQGLFALYLMLYAWEHPERLEASRGPREFDPPRESFTVLLPARQEQAVIGETIQGVWRANYPKRRLEIVVICHADDAETIEEARRTIRKIRSPRIRLETFSDGPINKPRALNVGLMRSSSNIVTVFDAEDDVHPDIFNVVNTVVGREHVGIVQGGVQLMNFRDRWFSLHNCLEYFFWFKSRLHFHAKVGLIPLGGNTIFIRRDLLERVGGWDEQCLTEDADIGIRLSALGEPIRVVYDAQHVTREETPVNVAALVRQRTRWSQGFLQVLRKGDWMAIHGNWRRLLAVYTFSYPVLQVMLTLLWPVALFGGLFLKLSVPVTMVAFLPLYALFFQFVATAVGAVLFTREYGQRVQTFQLARLAVTFLPYQWLLGISSLRAVYRELETQMGWEKTQHTGAHRRTETGPLPSAARLVAVRPRSDAMWPLLRTRLPSAARPGAVARSTPFRWARPFWLGAKVRVMAVPSHRWLSLRRPQSLSAIHRLHWPARLVAAPQRDDAMTQLLRTRLPSATRAGNVTRSTADGAPRALWPRIKLRPLPAIRLPSSALHSLERPAAIEPPLPSEPPPISPQVAAIRASVAPAGRVLADPLVIQKGFYPSCQHYVAWASGRVVCPRCGRNLLVAAHEVAPPEAPVQVEVQRRERGPVPVLIVGALCVIGALLAASFALDIGPFQQTGSDADPVAALIRVLFGAMP